MSRNSDQTIDPRELVSELTNIADIRDTLNTALKRATGRRAAAGAARGVSGLEGLTGNAARAKAIVVPPGLPDETRRVLEAGAAAVEKIKENGPDVPLTPDERLGVEAVINAVGRPAILIKNDQFAKPTAPWEILEPRRPEIHPHIPSVGRIEEAGPLGMAEVGTGFMVAPELVMTNKHVVEAIANPVGPEAGAPWQLRAYKRPQINFIAESGVEAKLTFPVGEVVAVHPTFDLALLRVGAESLSTPGRALPPPLPISSEPPGADGGRNVYVIGYPATDNEGLTPDSVMRRIFADIYEVKRLQPGHLTNRFDGHGKFTHDCSTLGGNSGSCVVDLDTGLVIGLHYAGSYMSANYAVALWQLTRDALLKDARVNFS